jgi:hypothetical protein
MMMKNNEIDLVKYLRNGIWLTVPILLWNAILASRLPAQFLPDIFWKEIPDVVAYGENSLRIVVVFAMPLFFSIGLSTKTQKQGLVWYLAGTAIYFLSWILQIYYPDSGWSTSMIGFLAPAYTPLVWLIGIGLLGEKFYFPVRYRPVYYIAPAILFLIFHNTHTAIVYLRNF